MRRVPLTAMGLAHAFLAGAWTYQGMLSRGEDALGGPHPKLAPIARLVMAIHREPPLGRPRALAQTISRLTAFHVPPDERQPCPPLRIRHWLVPKPSMARSLAPFRGLALPALVTPGDVAKLTSLTLEEVAWFADPKRLNVHTRQRKLQHYHYRWLPKRCGGVRLLEAPKAKLKRAQRAILHEILDHVPLHDACHGHRRGRSVRTFAALHCQREWVLALDLAEFFASVCEARVRALFAALGYGEQVAALLAGLCCTPTPRSVLASQPHPREPSSEELSRLFHQRQRLRTSHLPQGSPTSPMLANLCAYRLDARLSGLAASFGAYYGRYADDLAFSGGGALRRAQTLLVPVIGAIATEEGFALNFRKTRLMAQSQRQQLCAITVNEAPSLPRREVEQLEATLFNCVKHGPSSQNRAAVADFRAHLTGRVAWVTQVKPSQGTRLRALLAAIDWSEVR